MNLQGLHLDDTSLLIDYIFPSCVVPPGGVWIGYEDEEESHTYTTDGTLYASCTGSFTSGLSKDGDTVYLALGPDDGDASESVAYAFDEPFNGVITFDEYGNILDSAVGLTSLDLVYVQVPDDPTL